MPADINPATRGYRGAMESARHRGDSWCTEEYDKNFVLIFNNNNFNKKKYIRNI
jgi:hypothetical protein